MWRSDNELSRKEKLRRALYRTLRNELDYSLLQFGLIEPFYKFKKAAAEYKFVEKRELKPRAKVSEAESDLIDGFIVLFSEDAIPADLKKYIRYFDANKVTKENLPEHILTSARIAPELLKAHKYYEHAKFLQLLKSLLPVDYALLIQQDASSKKDRYYLSNFHVRIDWLIDFAAESLGKDLRYISKDLYEKEEKYAQTMVEKLFEYFSFHHTVSGRRTAAIVAYQLLSTAKFISTVYVNSSESRTLTRISEKGISKYCLVKIPKEHIEIAESHEKLGIKNFRKDYLIHRTANYGVGVFQVVYNHNEHSTPPLDGKLREVQPDVHWIRISGQYLLPKPSSSVQRPLRYSIIYDQQDPFSK